MTVFQYPRTDRMGCDFSAFPVFVPRPLLSVSSNGSNGLRQKAVQRHVVTPDNFQYPRTDRMGCDEKTGWTVRT